ncbi:hypothetical protein LX64_05187 [Chitinophaga skermanii]|uniref:Uncharacterized protein n=1 Tax=Chitinophaga skermanii TaxID=331697 RepID=A0A327PZQ2_9BACT|nr:hypothetical protein [Chitinophaga skermanii]RAI96987.1 hypothetical protein LX64_05187 [Chitinophaga skermanii]
MLLTPTYILEKLGFKIPDGGLNISDEDELVFSIALEMMGQSINLDSIEDAEYRERFKVMSVHAQSPEQAEKFMKGDFKIANLRGTVKGIHHVLRKGHTIFPPDSICPKQLFCYYVK